MNTSRQQLLTTRALAILVCVSACDEGSDPAPDEATNTFTASELALGDHTPIVVDAAPTVLDGEDLDYIAGLRDQLGFDADHDYIQDLYEDPSAFGGKVGSKNDLLGLILTDEEIAALRVRNRLEHHGGELQDWLRREHSAIFAGLYVDRGGSDQGGILHILLAAPAESLRVAIEEHVPLELRGHLVVDQVQFALEALITREDEVSRALADLQAQGYDYNGTAADVGANRVSVFVPADHSKALREALRRTVGLDMIQMVEEPGRARTTGWLKNQAYAWNLAAGGQSITDYQHGCTSAISAHGAFGPFMLTAGHCFPGEKTVYQGGQVLGVVKARSISGKVDAEAISTFGARNTAGRFHRNADDPWSPVHWAIGLEKDTKGSIVCTSGTTTTGLDGYKNPKVRCGALDQLYFKPNYVNYPNFSANFRIAKFASNPGDSGALVYWDTIYGTGAVGIVSGRTGEGFGIYSHLPYALAQWGLTLDAPG